MSAWALSVPAAKHVNGIDSSPCLIFEIELTRGLEDIGTLVIKVIQVTGFK